MGKYTKHSALRDQKILRNSSASMEREEMLIQHSVMALRFAFTSALES